MTPPLETPAPARVELTLRGLVLGVLITFVFTAANVYLGLKVGLTFASSIPAAVISMALLRGVKTSTIYENNIVQTVASAAGAMSSIIFVLPGLVMIGWWTGFPFWTSFTICAAGGVLGVMYTIPLRRALVTQSTLPYPEGVAAAEVLRVGSGATGNDGAAEGKAGLSAILIGTLASAFFALATATGIFAAEVARYFRMAAGSATGLGASMSMALIGAGHLMGIAVGLAMLTGLVIAWGVAVPILTHLAPAAGPAADFAQGVWSHKVRFIGAGAIGVAAIWTLGKLALPVWRGLGSALAAQSQRNNPGGGVLPRVEQDMPIAWVGVVCLVCLIPIAWVVAHFVSGGVLSSLTLPLTLGALGYVVVAGFAVAAVCGYMAGLIGSSNSPVSGMAILAVLGAALLTLAIAKPLITHGDAKPLVAFALLITAILLAVAVSANDNLQDLKTGQLVDATPWRQQVALVVGVVAGSAVIPPILDLLNKANGFAGVAGHAISANPLPAPQATLISTIATGVIEGHLDWGLIAIGGILGVVLVIVDEGLRATSRNRPDGRTLSLPPLGVGIAIYLPSTVTFPVVLGALAGWIFDRYALGKPGGEVARRLGVLMVSGLIVGEGLFNVALALLIVVSGNGTPLAVVGEAFAATGTVLAGLAFILVPLGLYFWTWRRAKAVVA